MQIRFKDQQPKTEYRTAQTEQLCSLRLEFHSHEYPPVTQNVEPLRPEVHGCEREAGPLESSGQTLGFLFRYRPLNANDHVRASKRALGQFDQGNKTRQVSGEQQSEAAMSKFWMGGKHIRLLEIPRDRVGIEKDEHSLGVPAGIFRNEATEAGTTGVVPDFQPTDNETSRGHAGPTSIGHDGFIRNGEVVGRCQLAMVLSGLGSTVIQGGGR